MKQCPVCKNYTIQDDYDICEVCFWEYDKVAQKYPNEIIGANNVSLKQAINNYENFGAIEEKYISIVQKPKQEEFPN
ncbi:MULTISPECIES: CPCC family cysteine-rich protein [Listeria]|uniref:Glycosyltransferase n=1 Tax=Listeria immobilis TaxID=2713502 RepID=A0A7X0X9L5_9LIST|nr:MULTISPECIES: CPCC family cysteine-rich protein [Listeria]MBC1481543.1 glycosyltransferase [Listeria seeligeri]MBC1490094.1 glycosyltransferase [Listeria immobilis]